MRKRQAGGLILLSLSLVVSTVAVLVVRYWFENSWLTRKDAPSWHDIAEDPILSMSIQGAEREGLTGSTGSGGNEPLRDPDSHATRTWRVTGSTWEDVILDALRSAQREGATLNGVSCPRNAGDARDGRVSIFGFKDVAAGGGIELAHFTILYVPGDGGSGKLRISLETPGGLRERDDGIDGGFVVRGACSEELLHGLEEELGEARRVGDA